MAVPTLETKSPMVIQGGGGTNSPAVPEGTVPGSFLLEGLVVGSNVNTGATATFEPVVHEKGSQRPSMLIAKAKPTTPQSGVYEMLTGASLSQNTGQVYRFSGVSDIGPVNTTNAGSATTIPPITIEDVKAGDLLTYWVGLTAARTMAAVPTGLDRITDAETNSNLHMFAGLIAADGDITIPGTTISGSSQSRLAIVVLKKSGGSGGALGQIKNGGSVSPIAAISAPVSGSVKSITPSLKVNGSMVPLV